MIRVNKLELTYTTKQNNINTTHQTIYNGYKTYVINVGDYRRWNKKWTIQRNWQHSVHKSQDEDKQSTKTPINMCWTPLYASTRK